MKKTVYRMNKNIFAILLSVGCLAILSGCDLKSSLTRKGSIDVQSTPAGAEVYLNGELKGITPYEIRGLAAGNHPLEIRKDDYDQVVRNVRLEAGQNKKLDIELVAATGLLLVESDPQGAEVIIAGVSKGTTPLLLTDLPLGEYEMEFRSPQLLPRTVDARLVDRSPVHVMADLMSNMARLEVDSVPAGAEVRIDGVLKGTTPAVIEDVMPGESDVRVSKQGYTPYVKRMTFEAMRPYKINPTLESLPSGLTVITVPEGARVMIDKIAVGEAPITLDNLREGVHEVSVELIGYAEQSKIISLEPDLNDSIEFELVKDSGALVLVTEPANVEVFVNGILLTTTEPRGGADILSQPLRISLKAGRTHKIQLIRDGFVASTLDLETKVDEVITRQVVLRRIFVYDTKITTDNEIIKCRLEYRLPNGDIRYERYPGVFDTVKAADIRDVQPITIEDESNREARRLMQLNRQAVPVDTVE